MHNKLTILLLCILLCSLVCGGGTALWLHYNRHQPAANQSNKAEVQPRNPEDIQKAQQLYKKARNLLDAAVENDISEVPDMLREAGEIGNADACLLLLELYCGKRKDVLADEKKAKEWVHKIRNHPYLSDAVKGEACYNLALYKENLKAKESYKEAYNNMKLAAEKYKSSKAQAELARYLMYGIGTRRDPQAAREKLKDLARHNPGTPNVFFYAGYMYSKGWGIYGGPDYKSAMFLYNLGKKYGDARAINNLAMMYERGSCVPADRNRALTLYRHAADLGCSEASRNMLRLSPRDTKTENSWHTRIVHATLRVIHALPLSDSVREQLEAPLRESLSVSP